MGLTEYALSQALKMALNHVEKSKIIVNTAREFDQLADNHLGSGSEKVQERVITQVLLPLCRELMIENEAGYISIIENEKYRLLGIKEQLKADDRRESSGGRNFQPGNRHEKLSGFTDGVVEA